MTNNEKFKQAIRRIREQMQERDYESIDVEKYTK